MPPRPTWEWLEAYGPVSAAPPRLFGDWPEAIAAVGEQVATLLPDGFLESELRRTRDSFALKAGAVRFRGSGWGALEEHRLGHRLVAHLDFGEPGDEQADWLSLLERGMMRPAGSPTYALDLAEAIFTIVEKGLYEGREGIYNYSNEGVCSWYDFAVEIAAASGHDKGAIVPCHSDEFPSKVTRPPYSVLDKSKFKKCFGLEIPHWRQSLLKCLSGKSMLQIAQETKK